MGRHKRWDMDQDNIHRKVEVLVTRRKGRVGAGLVGGILLGPLGVAAGALLGTRQETRTELRNPTIWEKAERLREERLARGEDPYARGRRVLKAVAVFFAICFGMALWIVLTKPH